MKYAFRKRQYVRSRLHGLGQVLTEGAEPTIRFLSGRECRVPAHTLTFTPRDMFEANLANRSVVEARLLVYVYGPEALPNRSGAMWVRDDDGCWTTPNRLPQEPQPPSEAPQYVSPDDDGAGLDVLDADGVAERRDVIDFAVTRLPGDYA